MVELYDLLMADIEPDLVTSTIPTLEEKYRGESPEDAKKRAERYAKAFVTFEERFQTVVAFWKKGLGRLKKDALAEYGAKVNEQDSEKLKSFGNLFTENT